MERLVNAAMKIPLYPNKIQEQILLNALEVQQLTEILEILGKTYLTGEWLCA